MEKNLSQSEWIFVSTILLLMLSIVAIGKINAKRTSSVHSEPIPSHELCKVTIIGEVAKPGTYYVLPGTLLKKVIKKSAPTVFADLKKILIDERVEQNLEIRIDPLSEISVTVEGKQITVPVGTRVCQLKKYVNVSNHKIFKSRRLLKDREIITREKQ